MMKKTRGPKSRWTVPLKAKKISFKNLFLKLYENNGTRRTFAYIFSYIFVCGSGSTKLLITDQIQLRILNTSYKKKQ